MLRTSLFAGLSAVSLTSAAGAEITIDDAYARGANMRAGAAFMTITNTGAADDRLVSATSDASERVELHTHVMDGDVMRMTEVEEGFVIPAGASHALARGGDHVMFMGLTAPFEDGATVEVTLTFEQAGDIVVEIPVDQQRGQGGQNDDPDHGEEDMDQDHDH